ncbi:UNKNOWN [Stylonychia lemnae]|uniref:EamA domain-containing protein n=1 Tax=Stylonychia lemnae TaxID=5949 RepID=A0A078B3X2_STYLE|nr:UNKNOWN [Stylonychia lemnae]|eukprot:CDW88926.1 UNKNOWN [Stylonychia lemnae]
MIRKKFDFDPSSIFYSSDFTILSGITYQDNIAKTLLVKFQLDTIYNSYVNHRTLNLVQIIQNSKFSIQQRNQNITFQDLYHFQYGADNIFDKRLKYNNVSRGNIFQLWRRSFISVNDEKVEKVQPDNLNILIGDISGILCSFSSAIFYQLNAKLAQKTPSSVTVTIFVIVSNIMIIIYGLLFNNFTFDRGIETGVWGFMNSQYILYNLFVLGFFCGAVCLYTDMEVLKYYPPIVFLIACLFEPIISQSLSCLLNIDKAPGMYTYIGAIITLFGIFAVGYGGQIIEKRNQ